MTLEEIVYAHYENLNKIDVCIWQYISRHMDTCKKLSIQQLAKACNVSHTTILRFAKKLGFEGYSELKVYMKWDSEKQEVFHKKMMNQAVDEMKKTLLMIEEDIDEALSYICQANTIYVYATGEVQYLAAQELKRAFAYKGMIMHVIQGEVELDTTLLYVQKQDLFFLISLSGENPTILTLADFLKRKHIKIIGIGMTESILETKCDAYLGFTSNTIPIGNYHHMYTCSCHFFMIVEMLFLKFIEYHQKNVKNE